MTGGKLMVVGAGPDRLEDELEGTNGNAVVADGSGEGMAVDGVTRV